MRTGTKFGDTALVDTMMKDGLIDAFNNYHMGITGIVVVYSTLRMLMNSFISLNLLPHRDTFSCFCKQNRPRSGRSTLFACRNMIYPILH